MATVLAKPSSATRLCALCAGLKTARCGTCKGWVLEDTGSPVTAVYDPVEHSQRHALDAFIAGIRPTRIQPLTGGMATLMTVWTPAALTADCRYLLPHECDIDRAETTPSDPEQGALL